MGAVSLPSCLLCRYPVPRAGRQDREQMKPHSPRGDVQWPAMAPQTHTGSTQGSWGSWWSTHWATFYPLQQSWPAQLLPADWKSARMTASCCKKGHKVDVGNFRRVSLTSVPGKAVEQIILHERHAQDKQVIGPASVGLWKASPAWLTWSPPRTRWPT